MVVVGIICSLLHGAAMPLMIVIFGDMTDTFIMDGRFDNLFDENADLIGNLSEALNMTIDKDYIENNFQDFV